MRFGKGADCAAVAIRGGLGEKSGPGVTVRPAHSIHGVRPSQYTRRAAQSAITSYMFVFLITFGSANLPGWTHGIK